MTRPANPSEICALCDEFSVRQAEPEYAALGMGRYLARLPPLSRHVAWDESPCVLYRLDRKNIAARQQYVQVQKLNRAKDAEDDSVAGQRAAANANNTVAAPDYISK